MKLQLYLTDFAENLHQLGEDAALARLLAAGHRQWLDNAMDAELCRLFSVAQQADWPLAPLTRLGQDLPPEEGYWLLATPVNFLLQRDHFLLNLPAPLLLSEGEAQALLDSLNQHFAPQQLQFSLAADGHWYLRLPASPGIHTHLLAEVVGRDVRAFLPQGQSAWQWRTLLNEVQMLLFEHEVNQARESRGELPVNSLWLSGGGSFPLTAQPVRPLLTDSVLVRGMAVAARMPVAAMLALAMLPMHTMADSIAVCRTSSLGGQWSKVLLDSLKGRKLSQLDLFFSTHERVLHLQLQPLDLWKFWRKPQTIEAYFNGTDHTQAF
ncbi:hypothetical protein LG201_00275 [Methylobacillus gramineus]|uniref:hypothetical protein n=1 Tax=Methylobacillus gramineus TaxID=755169 RepID=UPI001CFF6E25|nr:hypothetical protein [Methylobacillus gramineus]MCB5183641.1 hypothetical protein [Methylobacillus gramineus]